MKPEHMNGRQRAIWEALCVLNWNYGKGDVIEVDFTASTVTIGIRYVPARMTKTKHKFRFDSSCGTVHFSSHQRRIK